MENKKEEEKVNLSYETLWKFIIRPSRDDYKESLLGSPNFKFNGKNYHRKDLEIKSSEGYKMKCSFIEPQKKYRPSEIMPVVLYLHGNSSSRIEGLNVAPQLLKKNINIFLIDFPGCGKSEGEFISLGYHESNDVGKVIDYIEKIPGTGKIGIWGRSMGAATTMIYAHRDKRVKAICLDSPFADFTELAKELTLKQITLPHFIINIALSFVRRTVLSKNGLDIDKLKPINQAKKTYQPAFFIHALNDELIPIHHSIELFDAYVGKNKEMRYCESGGHNSTRPKDIMNEIIDFFAKNLIENDNNIVNNFNENEKINEEDNFFNNQNKEKIEYIKRKEKNNKKN